MEWKFSKKSKVFISIQNDTIFFVIEKCASVYVNERKFEILKLREREREGKNSKVLHNVMKMPHIWENFKREKKFRIINFLIQLKNFDLCDEKRKI